MNKILIPISIGELYDKISILQIKSERISDIEKLKNINNELAFLNNFKKDVSINYELYKSLLEINKTLWDIENNIREKERKKEFDDDFINLARNVYITNDLRSQIKKTINLSYQSDIIEEKSYESYL